MLHKITTINYKKASKLKTRIKVSSFEMIILNFQFTRHVSSGNEKNINYTVSKWFLLYINDKLFNLTFQSACPM